MLPPGFCVGYYLWDYGAVQGLLVHIVCYVNGCSVLVLGGGGGDLPTCGGWGVFLMVFSVSAGGLVVWGDFG